MVEERGRKSLLNREFWFGIELKYWVFAFICWAIAALCIYLMFVLTPIEVDLALSTVSTVVSLTSIYALFTSASRRVPFPLCKKSHITQRHRPCGKDGYKEQPPHHRMAHHPSQEQEPPRICLQAPQRVLGGSFQRAFPLPWSAKYTPHPAYVTESDSRCIGLIKAHTGSLF